MARGRPPEGAELVDQLEGSTDAKARLRAMLETLSGRQTVRQASRALGISTRRLHAVRRGLLQELLDRLEPRPAGRPPRPAAAPDGPTASLEAEVRRLRLDLQAARIREEIALAMPHVLTRRERAKKSRHSPRRQQAGNAN
jgi:transposase-like protein